ncbi:hypothetical protein FV141_01405 [Dermacoccus abyssi]|uniref:Uncharacterized protein n=1 Tax=Dermacoccus abyssi TaxID=322596 RepID=A0ABX5Z6S5_9MICO|nr:hypothetical protein FV141_01405 [Dermacoccus abyssi]
MGKRIAYTEFPGTEVGVPKEYHLALQYVLKQRGGWQAWWAPAEVDHLEIELNFRHRKRAGVVVRRIEPKGLPPHILASLTRFPDTVWPVDDRIELARSDLAVLLQRVAERMGLDAPPELPPWGEIAAYIRALR